VRQSVHAIFFCVVVFLLPLRQRLWLRSSVSAAASAVRIIRRSPEGSVVVFLGRCAQHRSLPCVRFSRDFNLKFEILNVLVAPYFGMFVHPVAILVLDGTMVNFGDDCSHCSHLLCACKQCE
jgi:hypothetical protein